MPEPANLIVFLSDNHNRKVSGCYGHPVVQSPNIDRIASSGTRFTDAYSASPICCPARAALACGRFPSQSGYWDMCIGYDGRVPSWMRRVRDQGHEVVSVGKLHFRSAEDDNGFSREIEPMHMLDGKGPLQMLLRCEGEEPPLVGQWKLYRERSGVGVSKYQEYDRRIADQAIDWLRENGRKAGKPWVLFVSFVSVHPPFEVPQEFWDLYEDSDIPLPDDFRPGDGPRHPAVDALRRHLCAEELGEAELRRITRGYLALVSYLDSQIGRVMGEVEALNLTDTTRYIYTSDHGEMLGSHGLLGKFNMYEDSIGVPLLMSGPGVPSCHVVEQLASHVDLFPTIVESVGAELAPEDRDLPGISLWRALEGTEIERPIFAEYHASGTTSGIFMLRCGPWKLIEHLASRPQLFNLDTDPGERNDLSLTADGRKRVAELRALLQHICDTRAVDLQAKSDQRAKMEFWGGKEALQRIGTLLFTPPPGETAEIEPRSPNA